MRPAEQLQDRPPPNPTRNNGGNGATGANTIGTGGGGSGCIQDTNPYPSARSGGGGAGGAFSGGAGGGGNYGANAQATPGGDYGGTGGEGRANTVPPSAGGAGNPGADTVSGDSRQGAMAEDGVGGIIWLVVGGNLSIGANGQIQAHGKDWWSCICTRWCIWWWCSYGFTHWIIHSK